MASIQKQTRRVRDPGTGKIKEKITYRVFIRLRGLSPITKTFSKKKLAEDFAKWIEGDQEAAEALGGKASALMRSMSLSELIDQYVRQYSGKDQSLGSKLGRWKEHYGQRSDHGHWTIN